MYISDSVVHIPEKQIKAWDYWYLWFWNDKEYVLTIEDWEFRVYQYEYWGEDTIEDYLDEDWRAYSHDYFEDYGGCMAKDSCKYQTIFINKKTDTNIEIASYIIEAYDRLCCDDMNDSLVEDRATKSPSESFIDFIRNKLSKIGERAYCYYK